MHSYVKEVARRFNIPLSPRSCTGDWHWDGKTLATHWQEGDCAAEEKAEKETGKHLVLFKSELKELPAHVLFHEMGHWLAAPDFLKDLPEWGLDAVGAADVWCANGGFHIHQDARIFDQCLVDEQEASRQEYIAYLLQQVWCHSAGVDPDYLGWLQHYSPEFKPYMDLNLMRHNRRYVVSQILDFLTHAESKMLLKLIGPEGDWE